MLIYIYYVVIILDYLWIQEIWWDFWGRHCFKQKSLFQMCTGITWWTCKLLSHVWVFVTPWTTPSAEFSRPECWSGEPYPFSRGSSQHTWRAGENTRFSAPTPSDSDSVGLGWSPEIFILTGTFWWFWWKISHPHLEKLLDTGRRKSLKKLLWECFGRLEKDVYSVKGSGIDGCNLEMLCYYLQKTEKLELEFTSSFSVLKTTTSDLWSEF